MELEVVFLEDPACSWGWAFQPVETTYLFEWGEPDHPSLANRRGRLRHAV